jgi:N-acyl-D-aspartate/D-glutamate deacylase
VYDLIIRGGRVLDGRDSQPQPNDVAGSGDTIVAVGDLSPDEPAGHSVETDSLVVCPGFINPLSPSYLSVLEDGASLGELVQGVTLQSEDNLRRELSVPWVGIFLDAASIAPVGRSPDSPTHPRTYGSLARVLGLYTRDLGLLTLPVAARRMKSLPAKTLRLSDRGVIESGYAADLVVLDPDLVAGRAYFSDPHRLSVGVREVIVNGVAVLRDEEPTDARPGRRLRRERGAL